MAREGFFARQASRRSLEPSKAKATKIAPDVVPSYVGIGARVTAGMPPVPMGQHLTPAGMKPMPVSVVSIGKKPAPMSAAPAGVKVAPTQYKGLL